MGGRACGQFGRYASPSVRCCARTKSVRPDALDIEAPAARPNLGDGVSLRGLWLSADSAIDARAGATAVESGVPDWRYGRSAYTSIRAGAARIRLWLGRALELGRESTRSRHRGSRRESGFHSAATCA